MVAPPVCLTTTPRGELFRVQIYPGLYLTIIWKPQNAFIEMRDLNSGLWRSDTLLPMKESIGHLRLPSLPSHQRRRTVNCNVPCPQDEALGAHCEPLSSPSTRDRTETLGPQPPSPQNPGALFPWLPSSPALLRPRPPSLLPRARPQEWRHMHLQLGNLIQVEGVGEAALDAFVWLQLDTSRLLFCWQEICPSPLLLTSAKGKFGEIWSPLKA